MRIPVSRLFLPIACVAALAVSVAAGETPPVSTGTAEPLVFGEPVPTKVEEPLWPEPDTSLISYYSSPYWHHNHFAALYVLSQNKEEAQVALEFYRRFAEDAVQLPLGSFHYDPLLCQAYARLAWMAKDSGDEAEYQRLVAQAVFWLRRWQLVDKGIHLDPNRWPAELEAAKTAPPINSELHDVLYMVLMLDRHANGAWVSQSTYDFEGFLKTLKEEVP